MNHVRHLGPGRVQSQRCSMAFTKNPRSLSHPQPAVEASLDGRGLLDWLDCSALGRAYASSQGFVCALWQALLSNPFAVLTVDDLCRPPASWTREFWACSTGPADSYSWPHSVPEIRLQMQVNLKKYCGNYLLSVLVISIFFLSKMPMAVLGLLAISGVLNGISVYAASLGRKAQSEQATALLLLTLASTGALLVYTGILKVLFWTGLWSFVSSSSILPHAGILPSSIA